MALPNRVESRRLTGRTGAAVAVLLVGLIAGCGEPTGPISDDVYVEAMSRLSYAQAKFPDRARKDSVRRAVFDDLRIRPEDLVAYAERWGDDTEKMFRLSELVRVRVDSLAALDAADLSAAPPDSAPDVPR